MKEDIGSRRKRGAPSKAKAAEMMHDGEAHGHELTERQRGYFGAIMSGDSPKKGSRRKKGKSARGC